MVKTGVFQHHQCGLDMSDWRRPCLDRHECVYTPGLAACSTCRLPPSATTSRPVTPAFDQPRTPALPLPMVCHLLGSGNQLHPTGLYQPALPPGVTPAYHCPITHHLETIPACPCARARGPQHDANTTTTSGRSLRNSPSPVSLQLPVVHRLSDRQASTSLHGGHVPRGSCVRQTCTTVHTVAWSHTLIGDF